MPGAAEHSFPLYSVLDARRLRQHLRDRLRALCDPAAEAEPYTVIICGGGPTGVETAGALAELFGALQGTGQADGRPAIGPAGRPRRRAARDRSPTSPTSTRCDKLTEKGVQITFGVAVSAVQADSVTLSDGSTVPTDTVIWAGGISGAPLVDLTGIPTGRGGRIDVAADLTVPGHPGVYAIGDVANIPGPDGHAAAPARLGGRSSPAGGRPRTSSPSSTAASPSRSTTTTRASWR